MKPKKMTIRFILKKPIYFGHVSKQGIHVKCDFLELESTIQNAVYDCDRDGFKAVYLYPSDLQNHWNYKAYLGMIEQILSENYSNVFTVRDGAQYSEFVSASFQAVSS